MRSRSCQIVPEVLNREWRWIHLIRVGVLVSAVTSHMALSADLIVSGIEGVHVWLSQPGGKLVRKQSLSNVPYNAGGVLADLNGDNNLDWFGVTVNPTPHQVWFGRGDGSFVRGKQIFGGKHASWGVAAADIDRDGDIDVLVPTPVGSGRCPPSELWMNNGRGKFNLGQLLDIGCSRSAVFADVNGDGSVDIISADTSIVGEQPTGPSSNRIWLNNGHGHFRDSGQRFSNAASYGVASADLDGDGRVDLVFANQGHQSVYFNRGNGIFEESTQLIGDFSAFAVAVGDLDGNGSADLVFAAADNSGSRVWLNDGHAHFHELDQRLGSGSALDVILVDFDQDGDLDVVLSNRNMATEEEIGGIFIWLNDGAAHLSPSGIKLDSGHFRKAVSGSLRSILVGSVN